MIKFINRVSELKSLSRSQAKLIVLFGRRRVGKTALIKKWGQNAAFSYTQAIEGSQKVQIEQIVADLAKILPQGVIPKSWSELFAVFKLIQGTHVLAIDEFPYLVQSNASLPSILQSWIDHDQPKGVRIVLLGSSQTMMHGLFLSSSSPLYERADLILKVKPMSFKHYCEACSQDPTDVDAFLKFSMMGGIPRYWQYVDKAADVLEVAEALFFSQQARLEDEPDRILKDEEIGGQQARAIFESLGRGSTKPSEIAGRLGIPQTAVSKPLAILMHANLVIRRIPFGDSPRNAKRTLYKIDDYALRFWYQVYSPHRTRWHLYGRSMKINLIREHAGSVLEDEYRKLYLEGSPYWEGDELEFDCVRYSSKDLKKVIVSEIKLKDLTIREKKSISSDIEKTFLKSQLAKKFDMDHVEVLGGKEALRLL